MATVTYLDLVDELFADSNKQFVSIDTEDYTTTVDSGQDEAQLRQLPSNLENNLETILDAFARKGYHATFFVLGRIADRIMPQLRRMVDEGHEVASHGMSHKRVLDLNPQQFQQELASSKKLLEDITGTEVLGFRSPMFSITNENLWALDLIQAQDYQYDSSISPSSNFAYGINEAPKLPHRLKNGLIEIPMSVFDRLGYPFMVGGGFYLRVYPLWLHKLFLKMRKEHTTNYYLHPWELDLADYNLWDQLPDKGKHWLKKPKLMKLIETYNRRDVLKKYLALIESHAQSNIPCSLNQALGTKLP